MFPCKTARPSWLNTKMNPILCLEQKYLLNQHTYLHQCDKSFCLLLPVCFWKGSIVFASHITGQTKGITDVTDLLFLYEVARKGALGGMKETKLLPRSNAQVAKVTAFKKQLMLLTEPDVAVTGYCQSCLFVLSFAKFLPYTVNCIFFRHPINVFIKTI